MARIACVRFLGICLLSIGLPGCIASVIAEVRSASRQSDFDQRVAQLEASMDIETLHSMCRDSNKEYKEAGVKTSSACNAYYRTRYTRLSTAPCDTVVKLFEKDFDRSYFKESVSNVKANIAIAQNLARCGHWSTLISQMYRFRGYSKDVLAALAGEHPVYEELLKYLTSGKGLFSGESGQASLGSLAEWLVKSQDSSACPQLHQVIDNIDYSAQPEILWFYYEKECRSQAVPMALARLTHDKYRKRVQACAVLGKLGDKSHIEKVRVLAYRDTYSHLVESRDGLTWRVYPVRKECTKALNKLELR